MKDLDLIVTYTTIGIAIGYFASWVLFRFILV